MKEHAWSIPLPEEESFTKALVEMSNDAHGKEKIRLLLSPLRQLFTFLIILSGFLLQGVKITSQETFEGMVREYAGGRGSG